MSRQTVIRFEGLRVEVVNDRFDKAMRIFNKKVQDSGLMQTLQSREFYEKPCEERKRRKAMARKRWLKQLERSQPGYKEPAKKK